MRFLRAFYRNPSGLIGLAGIVILVAIAVLAPIFLGDYATVDDFSKARLPPSWEHPFGTDALGRDLLARMLVATQLSLGLALVAEIISLVIAIPVGAVTALLGPKARATVLRFIDMMLALPALIVTIYLATILSPAFGLFGMAIGIAVPSAFRLARVVAAQAMSLAGKEYFHAARVMAVRPRRLLFRYVLPNVAETVTVAATVNIAYAILAFSGLSFLGIGVQPPDFDWGRMLTEGVDLIHLNAMATLGPLGFICAAALSFAFVGEALASAANPRLWTAEEDAVRTAERRSEQQASTGVSADESHGEGGAAGEKLLRVRDLKVTFPAQGRRVDVVKGISFDVGSGEMVGIVGESGSGKSMTAMAIARLVAHPGTLSGLVELGGKSLDALSAADLNRHLASHLAVVFQDPMSSLNPAMTIGRQLTEAVEKHRGLSRPQALDLALRRLGDVNLPSPQRQVSRYPHELSGGMRQRVMIAMGLMSDPELLICDEPTTALDVTVQAQIMELLRKVNKERGVGIILISHDLALIRQNCRRVLVMYAGRIIEECTSEHLQGRARHPYTRALLAAVPDMSQPRTGLLATIPGQPPDPAAETEGCAFEPRCPVAAKCCAERMPPLVRTADGGRVACWVASDSGASA